MGNVFMLLGIFKDIKNFFSDFPNKIANFFISGLDKLIRNIVVPVLNIIISAIGGSLLGGIVQLARVLIDTFINALLLAIPVTIDFHGKELRMISLLHALVYKIIENIEKTYYYTTGSNVVDMFRLTPINFFTGKATGVDPDPTNLSNPYWLSIKLMQDAIKPAAMTIFALIVMIELFQLTIRTEGMRNSGFESPFKLMLKVAICKILLDNTQMILEAIFNMANEMFVRVYDVAHVKSFEINLTEDKINDLVSLGWFPISLLWVQTWVGVGCIRAVMAIVPFLLLGRVVEMYIFIVLAPIPFATFASQEFSQVGKNFIKQFIGISLKVVVMYVILVIYGLVTAIMTFDVSNTTALVVLINTMYNFMACGNWWGALATLGAAVGLKPVLFAAFLIMSLAGADKYTKAITGAWY